MADKTKHIQLNKSSLKKDVPLSKWEFGIYIIIWFYFILRGMYDCYNLYNGYLKSLKYEPEYEPQIFGLQLAFLDFEWIKLIILCYRCIPWTVAYLCIARMLRIYVNDSMYMLLSTLLSCSFQLYFSNIQFMWYIARMYLVCGLCGLLRSKLLVWCTGLYFLYQVDFLEQEDFFIFKDLWYQTVPYSAVLSARAISIGLKLIRTEKHDWRLFLETNFYFWYFPSLIGSRFLIYEHFINQIYKPYKIINWTKWWMSLIKTTFYLIIWTIISQYVPFNHLIKSNPHPGEFNVFIHQSGQIIMGLNAYMELLIRTTFCYRFCQFDGFEIAPPPICIAHIALYSHMWRNFEISLHLWIKDEIFRPIARYRTHRFWRYFAAIPSFMYVVLFHGIQINHGTYIIFNICQYFVQLLIDHLYLNTKVGHYMEANYSSITLRRLAGLFGAISFYTSAYAYASHSLGFEEANDIYLSQYRKNEIISKLLPAYLFVYCHANISKQVNDWMFH